MSTNVLNTSRSGNGNADTMEEPSIEESIALMLRVGNTISHSARQAATLEILKEEDRVLAAEELESAQNARQREIAWHVLSHDTSAAFTDSLRSEYGVCVEPDAPDWGTWQFVAEVADGFASIIIRPAFSGNPRSFAERDTREWSVHLDAVGIVDPLSSPPRPRSWHATRPTERLDVAIIRALGHVYLLKYKYEALRTERFAASNAIEETIENRCLEIQDQLWSWPLDSGDEPVSISLYRLSWQIGHTETEVRRTTRYAMDPGDKNGYRHLLPRASSQPDHLDDFLLADQFRDMQAVGGEFPFLQIEPIYASSLEELPDDLCWTIHEVFPGYDRIGDLYVENRDEHIKIDVARVPVRPLRIYIDEQATL